MKEIYTGIDLGTDSIKVVVTEKVNDKFQVLASVSSPSNGIKNGYIVDVKLAIASVKNALKKIDVHAFKKEFVKNNVSHWDVFKDTANNSVLWLGDKAQKVWHETGMYMDDLIDIFPKR